MPSERDKTRRRWKPWQFSVRTLLIYVFVSSLAFAWLGIPLYRCWIDNHSVFVQGAVTSPSPVDIRCMIDVRASGSTALIVEVIPDGTLVKEGDWLVTLAEISEQSREHVITAPGPGQVVYANVLSSRSTSSVIIKPGTAIRERQIVMRLCDPSHKQVEAWIDEKYARSVRSGNTAWMSINGNRRLVQGRVIGVRKAEPFVGWTVVGREYQALVGVVDPSQVQFGDSADVRIWMD